MDKPKTGRIFTQALTVFLLVVVVLGVLLFPQLLSDVPEPEPAGLTVTEQFGDREAVTLRGYFEKAIPEGETLWLYAENAEILLTVQGEAHRYNGRENTPRMFRSPGSGWYGFSPPGLAAGEVLEFTLRSYYGESDRAAYKLLSRLYVGDGGGLYRLMLGQIDLFTMVLLCALVVGILYVVEGLISIQQGMRREGGRIGTFGAYCFTGAVWCVTDAFYPYLSLLLAPRWAAAFLDALGLLLFPVALAAMMHFYVRGVRTRRVMGAVVGGEAVTAAICLIRQLTGQIDLIEQQLLISVVALTALGTSIICIGVDLWRYRDNYLFLLLLTALPVFVAVALDGANLLFSFMPRRTVMRYGFSISVILLMLQIVSYARAEVAKGERMRRLERELENSRISVMLSQIQPHFLYNALAGIKELCDTGEQRATSQALEHFAYYLRGNMDSLSGVKLIPFTKEADHVRDYLYLEKIRFEEKLTVRWALQFTDFLLPPLTLQPIVENAVRHGITEKKGGGTLTICSERTEGNVLITVTDDGVGFSVTGNMDDGRSHIGISNVKKRLAAQCGGRLLIESAPGSGATVKIILPEREVIANENYGGGR